MSEDNQSDLSAEAAAGAADQEQARFALQRIYTKDVSFETPNSPQIFQEQGQLEMSLNLSQRLQELGEDMYEIALTVTVTGTLSEKTAYLCEVQQAGIFQISGVEENQRAAMINVLCPNTLYPYARATVTQLVAGAGFPPVVLQPINFEQMYAQRLQEQQGDDGSGNGADNA